MSSNSKTAEPRTSITRIPTCPEHGISRRHVLRMALGLGACSLTGGWHVASARERVIPTPDQILGPFYPVQKPTDGGNDLARLKGRTADASGEIIYVMGRVLDMQGQPVRDARLEIWQANSGGRYTHASDRNPAPLDPNFEGYGVVRTDGEGRYRFRTVKPGSYPVSATYTRPPHIHFDVSGHVNRLVTQMYFPDEPLNEKDFLLQRSWAREQLIARVLPPTPQEEPESKLVVWDVVLIQG